MDEMETESVDDYLKRKKEEKKELPIKESEKPMEEKKNEGEEIIKKVAKEVPHFIFQTLPSVLSGGGIIKKVAGKVLK